MVHIRSDNGTNFIGAEKELKEALAELNHQRIQGALLQTGVGWSFDPPAGSLSPPQSKLHSTLHPVLEKRPRFHKYCFFTVI